MADKSFIVALSPNAAYTTAVVDWGWQCDRRNIPEFQTKTGEVVEFLRDGRITVNNANKFQNANIYLGKDWQKREDAEFLAIMINAERLNLKNGK